MTKCHPEMCRLSYKERESQSSFCFSVSTTCSVCESLFKHHALACAVMGVYRKILKSKHAICMISNQCYTYEETHLSEKSRCKCQVKLLKVINKNTVLLDMWTKMVQYFCILNEVLKDNTRSLKKQNKTKQKPSLISCYCFKYSYVLWVVKS